MAIGLALLGLVAGGAQGQGDAAVVDRIIEEGRGNSRVWEYMSYLSESIGPRLTGSTALDRANAWTRDEFAALGLTDCRLEKWGEIPVRFDRGPSTARMVAPVERDFELTARAWSAGTKGAVRGKVLKAPKTLEALEAARDGFAGAWVLDRQPQRQRRRRGQAEDDEAEERRRAARELREAIDEALREAGIAGRIYGARTDLVVTGAARGWREMEHGDLPTDVTVYVRRSDYDAMNSRLADGEAVEVEVDLRHHFTEGPFPLFNTIAEIRGTEKPEECVIVSGHLDSWDGPGTQGAQDNASGCAVALEAARILMAVGARPKRTIRFILWTGEEQGLLGSRAYVENLSDEEKAGISAVFVEDGGTNYQGGLVCIESMRPMLEAATAPVTAAFPDMAVEMNVRERMPRGGGSDHSPFNRAGIPGFFWMEKGVGGREGKNYRFIHHTQNDVMRYAVPEYMVQSAVCSAVTAYNLAMADALLPRQPREEEQVVSAPTDAPTDAPSAADEKPFHAVPGPIAGEWTIVMGEGDFEFTIVFETSDDGRHRGKLDTEFGGGGPLHDIAYDAATGKLTFKRRSERMGLVNFRATVEGDTMRGTLAGEEGFEMEFKGARKKGAPDVVATPAAAAAPAPEAPGEGGEGGS